MTPDEAFVAWFERVEGYEYMEGDLHSDEKRWAYEAGAEFGAKAERDALRVVLAEAQCLHDVLVGLDEREGEPEEARHDA